VDVLIVCGFPEGKRDQGTGLFRRGYAAMLRTRIWRDSQKDGEA